MNVHTATPAFGSSRIENGVAVVEMNNPPVNPLSVGLRRFVLEAIDGALDDPSVRAIVLSGNGRAFSAGADIKEFGTPAVSASPALPLLVRVIENAPKPVVAAITGLALGGGLELALSCDARVAHPAARLGLPEVTLGLIPGEGGTQRLPRAIGVEPALELILSGKPAFASRFMGTGLVAEVAEDPVAAAIRLAGELARGSRPRVHLRDIVLDANEARPAVERARRELTSRHLELLGAIDAVEAALDPDFETGYATEQRIYQALYHSPESAAMRHAFLAERAAGKFETSMPARAPIRSVGIVGSGTMGRGIGLAIAQAGFPVVLVDANPEALKACEALVAKTLDSAVARGRMDAGAAEATRGRLRFGTALGAVATADLVIEAIFEDMDAKLNVFQQLDAICAADAILASNTSMLNIDRIAAGNSDPTRVLGMHFFSPANIMRLLEVVWGEKTADDVLAEALRFARKIGKVPVISRVCEGFIGNRMINAYLDEALFLLEEGISPYRIDSVIEAWGMAMGPFRMMDLAGNDVSYLVRKARYAEHPDEPISRIADPMVEEGRLGQKTGKGWYEYSGGSRRGEPDQQIEEMLARYNAEHGNAAADVSDREIVDRCILALVNEGARLLGEGIAQSASDIDAVYLTGYGFPARRGGPMFYAERRGLYEVARAMRKLAAQSRHRRKFWQPAPLIAEAAAAGEAFDQVVARVQS